jgi:hypothetical protein
MAAKIQKLKGQLKMDPKLTQIARGGNKGKDGGKRRAKKKQEGHVKQAQTKGR